ncbi:MAG: hypothetical protein M0C28_36765 [Candidatus Moduliflexus flocculans]|nr:hypothetical protein [Candidatus Moduliflexus flocculans]
MTASERYWFASMRYGDELFTAGKICEENEAIVQYNNAQLVAALDKTAQDNFDQAILICFPPTGTPDLSTPTPTPTGIVPTVETIPPTSYP